MYRDSASKDKLIKRLNVIDGQVKGIIKMVEEDRFCDEILIQVSAVRNSLKSIGNELLIAHLKTCVKDALKNDEDEAISDVIRLIEKVK
jgi:DNA-binding FrmR family transcriptional regulator